MIPIDEIWHMGMVPWEHCRDPRETSEPPKIYHELLPRGLDGMKSAKTSQMCETYQIPRYAFHKSFFLNR